MKSGVKTVGAPCLLCGEAESRLVTTGGIVSRPVRRTESLAANGGSVSRY